MTYRVSEIDRALDNQSGLYFTRHKEATVYSRMVLLKLARLMFLTRSALRRDVQIRGTGELAVRIQFQMKGYLDEVSCWGLYRALHREAKANGLLNGKVRFKTTKAVRAALDSLVSWLWVARELKEEWERHGHRSKHRHAELSSGLTWEELEFAEERAEQETRLAAHGNLFVRVCEALGQDPNNLPDMKVFTASVLPPKTMDDSGPPVTGTAFQGIVTPASPQGHPTQESI